MAKDFWDYLGETISTVGFGYAAVSSAKNVYKSKEFKEALNNFQHYVSGDKKQVVETIIEEPVTQTVTNKATTKSAEDVASVSKKMINQQKEIQEKFISLYDDIARSMHKVNRTSMNIFKEYIPEDKMLIEEELPYIKKFHEKFNAKVNENIQSLIETNLERITLNLNLTEDQRKIIKKTSDIRKEMSLMQKGYFIKDIYGDEEAGKALIKQAESLLKKKIVESYKLIDIKNIDDVEMLSSQIHKSLSNLAGLLKPLSEDDSLVFRGLSKTKLTETFDNIPEVISNVTREEELNKLFEERHNVTFANRERFSNIENIISKRINLKKIEKDIQKGKMPINYIEKQKKKMLKDINQEVIDMYKGMYNKAIGRQQKASEYYNALIKGIEETSSPDFSFQVINKDDTKLYIEDINTFLDKLKEKTKVSKDVQIQINKAKSTINYFNEMYRNTNIEVVPELYFETEKGIESIAGTIKLKQKGKNKIFGEIDIDIANNKGLLRRGDSIYVEHPLAKLYTDDKGRRIYETVSKEEAITQKFQRTVSDLMRQGYTQQEAIKVASEEVNKFSMSTLEWIAPRSIYDYYKDIETPAVKIAKSNYKILNPVTYEPYNFFNTEQMYSEEGVILRKQIGWKNGKKIFKEMPIDFEKVYISTPSQLYKSLVPLEGIYNETYGLYYNPNELKIYRNTAVVKNLLFEEEKGLFKPKVFFGDYNIKTETGEINLLSKLQETASKINEEQFDKETREFIKRLRKLPIISEDQSAILNKNLEDMIIGNYVSMKDVTLESLNLKKVSTPEALELGFKEELFKLSKGERIIVNNKPYKLPSDLFVTKAIYEDVQKGVRNKITTGVLEGMFVTNLEEALPKFFGVGGYKVLTPFKVDTDIATLLMKLGSNSDARKFVEDYLAKNPNDFEGLIKAISQNRQILFDFSSYVEDMPHIFSTTKSVKSNLRGVGTLFDILKNSTTPEQRKTFEQWMQSLDINAGTKAEYYVQVLDKMFKDESMIKNAPKIFGQKLGNRIVELAKEYKNPDGVKNIDYVMSMTRKLLAGQSGTLTSGILNQDILVGDLGTFNRDVFRYLEEKAKLNNKFYGKFLDTLESSRIINRTRSLQTIQAFADVIKQKDAANAVTLDLLENRILSPQGEVIAKGQAVTDIIEGLKNSKKAEENLKAHKDLYNLLEEKGFNTSVFKIKNTKETKLMPILADEFNYLKDILQKGKTEIEIAGEVVSEENIVSIVSKIRSSSARFIRGFASNKKESEQLYNTFIQNLRESFTSKNNLSKLMFEARPLESMHATAVYAPHLKTSEYVEKQVNRLVETIQKSDNAEEIIKLAEEEGLSLKEFIKSKAVVVNADQLEHAIRKIPKVEKPDFIFSLMTRYPVGSPQSLQTHFVIGAPKDIIEEGRVAFLSRASMSAAYGDYDGDTLHFVFTNISKNEAEKGALNDAVKSLIDEHVLNKSFEKVQEKVNKGISDVLAMKVADGGTITDVTKVLNEQKITEKVLIGNITNIINRIFIASSYGTKDASPYVTSQILHTIMERIIKSKKNISNTEQIGEITKNLYQVLDKMLSEGTSPELQDSLYKNLSKFFEMAEFKNTTSKENTELMSAFINSLKDLTKTQALNDDMLNYVNNLIGELENAKTGSADYVAKLLTEHISNNIDKSREDIQNYINMSTKRVPETPLDPAGVRAQKERINAEKRAAAANMSNDAARAAEEAAETTKNTAKQATRVAEEAKTTQRVVEQSYKLGEDVMKPLYKAISKSGFLKKSMYVGLGILGYEVAKNVMTGWGQDKFEIPIAAKSASEIDPSLTDNYDVIHVGNPTFDIHLDSIIDTISSKRGIMKFVNGLTGEDSVKVTLYDKRNNRRYI